MEYGADIDIPLKFIIPPGDNKCDINRLNSKKFPDMMVLLLAC